jgi:Flp pilus assembly pilin Flp
MILGTYFENQGVASVEYGLWVGFLVGVGVSG